MIRVAVWTVLGVCVVLAARAVVYALAPWQTLAVLQLEHQAGGPQLAAVLAVSLAAAAALAAAVLWLAVVAVRERLALEPRALVERPRLSLLRVAVRGVVFFAATSAAFALFESYLHWRAGLGWHGLHCLVGPVHRDAIPILGALSLLAVAGHGAVEHLLGWARRLVALLTARLPLLRGMGRVFSSTSSPRSVRRGSAAAPRGPPVGSFGTT
jgi:Na+/proline symporter